MSETPTTPDEFEPFSPENYEVEGTHAHLLAAVDLARAWLEHTAEEGGATDEEVMLAKIRKQEANERLVNFEVTHGIIAQPEETGPEHYLPETLGLDPSDQDDLQLYVESGGRRALGELLIDKRALTRKFMESNLTREEYDTYARHIDDRIADLRLRYFGDNET